MTTWGTTESKEPVAEWVLWSILLGTSFYALSIHFFVEGIAGLVTAGALYVQMKGEK